MALFLEYFFAVFSCSGVVKAVDNVVLAFVYRVDLFVVETVDRGV